MVNRNMNLLYLRPIILPLIPPPRPLPRPRPIPPPICGSAAALCTFFTTKYYIKKDLRYQHKAVVTFCVTLKGPFNKNNNI